MCGLSSIIIICHLSSKLLFSFSPLSCPSIYPPIIQTYFHYQYNIHYNPSIFLFYYFQSTNFIYFDMKLNLILYFISYQNLDWNSKIYNISFITFTFHFKSIFLLIWNNFYCPILISFIDLHKYIHIFNLLIISFLPAQLDYHDYLQYPRLITSFLFLNPLFIYSSSKDFRFLFHKICMQAHFNIHA